MSEISDIVDVQISIQDTAVSRAGFGVALIVGPSNRIAGKTQSFGDYDAVAELYEDGDPELEMAEKYFGQDLKPDEVILGKRAADVAQIIKILIPTVQDTTLYSIGLVSDGISYGTASFTSDGTATRAEIVNGLISALAALNSPFGPPVTTTNNGDDFDILATVAGDAMTLTLSVNLAQQVVTANVNITTELAAMKASNPDWYCLLLSSHTEKDVLRAAGYIQTQRKIYIAASQASDIINPERHVQTLTFDANFVSLNVINLTIAGIPVATTTFTTNQATTLNLLATNIAAHVKVFSATVTGLHQITITAEDYDVLLLITGILVTLGGSQAVGTLATTVDPTTDLGSQLKALSYDRTALFYHSTADASYPEAAWAGGLLPEDAGSVTWFAKRLRGIAVDTLSTAQVAKALGNNVTIYEEIGSVGFTRDGKTASGRFIDVRMGVDYVQARMEENIFSRIVNLKKIPYTDQGATIIENEIRFTLDDGIEKSILAKDPPYTVSVPKVASVSSNDRANRLLPDITWEANLAGAIHKAVVRGTVSV